MKFCVSVIVLALLVMSLFYNYILYFENKSLQTQLDICQDSINYSADMIIARYGYVFEAYSDYLTRMANGEDVHKELLTYSAAVRSLLGSDIYSYAMIYESEKAADAKKQKEVFENIAACSLVVQKYDVIQAMSYEKIIELSLLYDDLKEMMNKDVPQKNTFAYYVSIDAYDKVEYQQARDKVLWLTESILKIFA